MTTGNEPDDAGTGEASTSGGAGAVEDLHCRSVAATPQRLDGLRRQVGEWAGRTGLAVSRVQDLVLAVYEALANVAAHAYHAQPGPLDLHARHHDGRVTVTVTDHGQWTPAPVPGLLHGRGLPLIHTLADEATFTTSPAGTTVEMTWTCTPAA
ncbi:ATP-binding protein [Amycolatopsis sp. cmx-4-68]|uniref:ATP-binding protein n=1 Tax=Amycolatopsis sp. cmx-4-68 TaxID=2790938 RepID=UPI00397E71C7